MPWHNKLARDAGLSGEDLLALRSGTPLADPKLEALHVFTRQVVRERGRVSQRMLGAFFDAGWEAQQVLEVILGVAIKTMSNYTNAIVRIPLDEIVRTET